MENSEFIDLLNIPRFTKKSLLNAPTPPIGNEQFRGWLHRELFVDEGIFCAGELGADDFRRIGEAIKENKERSSHKRLYTGASVLQAIVLQTLSRAGIEFTCFDKVFQIVFSRLQELLVGYKLGGLVAYHYKKYQGENVDDLPDNFPFYGLLIHKNERDKYEYFSVNINELTGIEGVPYFTIIQVDQIVLNFKDFLDAEIS